MIDFQTFTLLDNPGKLIEGGGPALFDIIFCRNVIRHFDRPIAHRVLMRMAGVMASDGVLCLGDTDHSVPFVEKSDIASRVLHNRHKAISHVPLELFQHFDQNDRTPTRWLIKRLGVPVLQGG
jgi:chemotaxis methyl-accepting protein methylase